MGGVWGLNLRCKSGHLCRVGGSKSLGERFAKRNIPIDFPRPAFKERVPAGFLACKSNRIDIKISDFAPPRLPTNQSPPIPPIRCSIPLPTPKPQPLPPTRFYNTSRSRRIHITRTALGTFTTGPTSSPRRSAVGQHSQPRGGLGLEGAWMLRQASGAASVLLGFF